MAKKKESMTRGSDNFYSIEKVNGVIASLLSALNVNINKPTNNEIIDGLAAELKQNIIDELKALHRQLKDRENDAYKKYFPELGSKGLEEMMGKLEEWNKSNANSVITNSMRIADELTDAVSLNTLALQILKEGTEAIEEKGQTLFEKSIGQDPEVTDRLKQIFGGQFAVGLQKKDYQHGRASVDTPIFVFNGIKAAQLNKQVYGELKSYLKQFNMTLSVEFPKDNKDKDRLVNPIISIPQKAKMNIFGDELYNELNKIVEDKTNQVNDQFNAYQLLVISKIVENVNNEEIKSLLTQNIMTYAFPKMKKALISLQSRSNSAIKGSIAEIYWITYFNFLGFKAVFPTGLIKEDGQQINPDIIFNTLGISVKNYTTFKQGTSNVMTYGGRRGTDEDGDEIALDTLLRRLGVADVTPFNNFYYSYHYNVQVSEEFADTRSTLDELNDSIAQGYLRNNVLYGTLLMRNYGSKTIGELRNKTNNELLESIGKISDDIDIQHPTFYAINDFLVPASSIVGNIIQALYNTDVKKADSLTISIKQFEVMDNNKIGIHYPTKSSKEIPNMLMNIKVKYLLLINLTKLVGGIKSTIVNAINGSIGG